MFVAVDNQFSARIPKKECNGRLRVGDMIDARVTAVKEDGKLDLSVRDKIPEQMDKMQSRFCRKSKSWRQASVYG